MTGKTEIYIYADWKGIDGPIEIGKLAASQGKGKKTFSFEYNKAWIKHPNFFLLDPDLERFSGPQYPRGKENFGIFMDSMPDTWGRTLLKRHATDHAKRQGTLVPTLYDIDYLLGVNDESRMGALRFKLDRNGPFLNNDQNHPTPPWAHLIDLQNSADKFEKNEDSDDVREDIKMLMAPGSSLGGARPKANIIDEKMQLWIAKFPSKNDTIDKAAWEYLAYKLALKAGVEMSDCILKHISGEYSTFLTKRFDRDKNHRIHFSSAMTMTGNVDGNVEEETGYLDIAEFIQSNGAAVDNDLHQLWRRIIFNIAISNTDDHLRNHGFLLTDKGWRLSPAYDLNPSIDKDALAITIDSNTGELNFEIAFSVGEYFRLNKKEMEEILSQVKDAVQSWRAVANSIKIKRSEIELMAKAFKFG
ncbi:type II toxin-antitoxin system HipA family toxin [Pedobacter sp. CFBP9032]|uniref:type II toxin-antitoxin system HipA family toxin n=1 Tax=Pedobacter sp. CFBP9032 TaxID=3096539 RepID=UPI002A6B6514|nr:HipA domain-containing protein [Pedobacter sp. CFBP9032]MDY0907416.1 HipA domain-containing protein [Pedobacter sp. CFBP9032]